MHRLMRPLTVLLAVVLCALVAPRLQARDLEQPAVVNIAALPYIDMRSGPGRGYPVITVAERGERLLFIKRRTDWFKVRNARGQEGWAYLRHVEQLLDDPAISEELRLAILGTPSDDRLEIGFAAGQLEDEPVVSLRGGYWLSDELFAELSVSQVSGSNSSSRLYSAGLQISPWAQARYAPYFGLAYGRFNNDDSATLVGGGTEEPEEQVSVDAGLIGVGLRAHFARQFVIRLDYRHVLVLTDSERYDDFGELVGGFAFKF